MIRPALGEAWRVELALSKVVAGMSSRPECLVLSSVQEARSDSKVVWRCLVPVPGRAAPVDENLVEGYDTRLEA